MPMNIWDTCGLDCEQCSYSEKCGAEINALTAFTLSDIREDHENEILRSL